MERDRPFLFFFQKCYLESVKGIRIYKGQEMFSLLSQVFLVLVMLQPTGWGAASGGNGEMDLALSPIEEFVRGMERYGQRDYQGALHWFRLGAEGGHVDSILQIGMMYDFGIGVCQNFPEARRWYLKAADQKNGQALYLIGHMFEYGEGVPKNLELAKMWYQRAAAKGNASAQFLLAKITLETNPGEKSKAKALKLLWSAAAKCHVAALRELKENYPEMASRQKGLCYF